MGRAAGFRSRAKPQLIGIDMDEWDGEYFHPHPNLPPQGEGTFLIAPIEGEGTIGKGSGVRSNATTA